MGIGNARNPFEVRTQAGGQRISLAEVQPLHLHIDGRGQAEVEDLRRDVGGLKPHAGAGEIVLQDAADFMHITAGGMVPGPEGNGDFRIHGADVFTGDVSQVVGIGNTNQVIHRL